MSRPTSSEKSWVQSMVEKSQKKDEAPKPSAKNDVDTKEVEDLTNSIRRRIQRGE